MKGRRYYFLTRFEPRPPQGGAVHNHVSRGWCRYKKILSIPVALAAVYSDTGRGVDGVKRLFGCGRNHRGEPDRGNYLFLGG